MHILGKILIWLVVLAAGGATYLTVRLLDIRNSWQVTLAQLEATNKQDAATIEQKRRELQTVRDQFAHTMLGWDTYWTGRSGGQAQIANGVLPIGIGTNSEGVSTAINVVGANRRDGFGTRGGQAIPQGAEQPSVHAFRPLGNGEFVYVGEFQAVSINPNDASVKALWNLRPGESDAWQFSDQWRFRTSVPPHAVTQLISKYSSLNTLDETLADKNRFVATQTQLVTVADEQLNHRREELVGTGMAPPLDPAAVAPDEKIEFTHGLLAALALEEERRNAAHLEVDVMRRRLKVAFEKLQELVKQNNALAGTLPQPAPPAGLTTPVSVNGSN